MSFWTWPPPLPAALTARLTLLQQPGAVSLAVPPSVLGLPVGATDAEFDADPGWLYYEVNPSAGAKTFAGVPNWDARIAGANPAISFTQRKSFVTLQPCDNTAGGFDAFYYYPQPITWVANTPKWYWCSAVLGYEWVQDNRRAMCVANALAGHPDRANMAALGMADLGFGPGFQQLLPYSYAANVPSAAAGGSLGNGSLGQGIGGPWPYMALYMQSAGNRAAQGIEAWVFDDRGQRMRLAVISFGQITPTFYVGFYLRTPSLVAATGFQVNIFQCDFWRESVGVTPPWQR